MNFQLVVRPELEVPVTSENWLPRITPPKRPSAVVVGSTDRQVYQKTGQVGRRAPVDNLSVSFAKSDVERLFDARVNLKVATSQYAMHLSDAVRKKMFSEFDYLLDAEAWDLEDTLPSIESYRHFLRWLVYTGDTSWTSFGVADDGSLLVAWVHIQKRMTASFGPRIRWTQEFRADGEPQILSGNFTLEHFARQAGMFLGT